MTALFTANQIIAHMIGDYVVQSDWMASQKTKSHWPCIVHAATYTLVFLALTQSIAALLVIGVTHFIIDRWRLARYVVKAKNMLLCPPQDKVWIDGNLVHDHLDPDTGSGRDKPAFLSVWLLIIVDNLMHLCINAVALRWL